MRTIGRLWRIVVYPRRTSREILQDRSIHASLAIVLGFALVLSLLFLISHFRGDYPPPPQDLETWIETWGEFAMLPFVKIQAEHYRLAQAIFFTPMMLGTWLLMAGTARVLSLLWGGKVSFEQYLNLFGYSFFAFWILGSVLDTIYSGLLGRHVLQALRGEYGPLAKMVFANFPSLMWTIVLGLGGVYNAIASHEAEQFSWLKAALVGAATFFWPMVLISLLVR
jgi:hypothetical protein